MVYSTKYTYKGVSPVPLLIRCKKRKTVFFDCISRQHIGDYIFCIENNAYIGSFIEIKSIT